MDGGCGASPVAPAPTAGAQNGPVAEVVAALTALNPEGGSERANEDTEEPFFIGSIPMLPPPVCRVPPPISETESISSRLSKTKGGVQIILREKPTNQIVGGSGGRAHPPAPARLLNT